MTSFLKILTRKPNFDEAKKYWAKPQPEADLSKYYPKGTVYFYSFPSGEDSNFFNLVPSWKEELVAARPLICAGKDVRVMAFATTFAPKTWNLVTEELGVPLISRENVISLPPEINAALAGPERNKIVKSSLKNLVTPGSLVMTQPFLDLALHDTYQLPPDLIINLNDKYNRDLYIPQKNLPKKYASFGNGQEFVDFVDVPVFPCVVKVTSSSSGDGVRICRNEADLASAKKTFGAIRGKIVIEEFIQAIHNLGIQFGIPHDKTKPIEIIGHNEQLTTDQGDYLGGVVNPHLSIEALDKIHELLLKEALPKVRAMGWYGVGGIDVLINSDNNFYFIDPNFRMTAAFTYVYLVRNKKIDKPIVSFTGIFHGSRDEFLSKIGKFAKSGSQDQMMSVIALTHEDNTYRFNAGMFFDQQETVKENVRNLLDLGIESTVLDRINKEL